MKDRMWLYLISSTQTLLLFLALTVVSVPGLSQAEDEQLVPVTLQLRWYHQFQFAGYYAALEKGYYREAGFKVLLQQGGVKVDTVQEVVTGHAQYGVTNSEILLQRLKGAPIVVLAAIFQHSPLIILARKETGITNPQDMRGRTVKMSRTSRDIELQAMLQKEGINLDQISIIEGGATYDDYFDPAIDALSAYLTNQPQYLDEKRISYTVIKPQVYGVDFYGDSLFTSEQELAKYPERVSSFRQASLKGWQYAMDHPDEIITLILAKYASKKNRAHLVYEAEAMKTLILADYVDIGHMNPGRWKYIAEIFAEQGMISSGYSLDGFIYNPDPYEALTLLRHIIIILVGLSCFICLISLVLYTFNKKLKGEISEHIETTLALTESQETILNYSRQIEQFSLSAASVLSIRDEKLFGQKISQAIIENSDYRRVLISLWIDKYPYREIIGYGGLAEDVVERIKDVELSKSWYDNVFKQGIKIRQLSYYIPHSMKYILNPEATDYGSGDLPENDESWHPEDNLFVRMHDEDGNLIGIISVDNSKSGRKPTDELVRPLEIFSSLISQIIVLKREHERSALLEEQLRQAQKMEAIGNLTGGIAHDFNNILGVIIGNADLAILNISNHDQSRVHFKEIKIAGIRARDIVSQLLSFSRKSLQVNRPILLQVVIEESLTFMRSTIPSTINVDRNLCRQEQVIKADHTQIYQIMINLCTNAIHAMDAGGTLSVTLDRVSADEITEVTDNSLESKEYCRIVVSDTGKGIPPELMHKIFDPYFTTKEVGKGTGIGLAVVHGIVKSHNGFISVSSNPGEGTLFSLFFPATDEPIYRTIDEARQQAFVGRGRILFVDDEPSLLSIGKRMLENFGYEVETFEDPVEALEQFKKNPDSYNLLVTDFTMPNMTGDILARKVMALALDIPVILCTGFTEKIDEKEAMAIGIKKYLKKPLSMDTLAKAVSDTLTS